MGVYIEKNLGWLSVVFLLLLFGGFMAFDLNRSESWTVIFSIIGILTVLIGVNDTWHEQNYGNGVEPERYDKFYRMLMDWTKEVLPDTRMILLEPFILEFGFVTGAWEQEVEIRRQMVRKIAADYGAVFVPLQKIISEKAAEAADPEIVLRDGVHPTLFGHQLIADQYLKYAGELLK